MRRPLKILITLGALALIPIMVERTGEKVKAYPGASSAHAELERGLDFLMTGKNIPMDFLSAIEKFSQVAPEHGATSLEAEIAEFLSAWCIWADPSSDNKRKEMALSDFQLKYPDSPFLAHALFMRALIESTSIPQTGPDTAISTYKKIVQDYPDSTLADLSRLALAGLYREQVHDLRESARWYGEVVRSGTDTFLLHEIELFHYLQAKMLQEAGDADEARRIYHAILESEKKSAGNWKDRALDRLAELGEKVQDESWGEVQQTSFPMQNHSFSSDKPITLRISSWILEKKGMLEAFTQIGEKYHEHNPDVTIEWISLPYTGYHDWLQTQILSDEIPDIVQIDNGTAVRYGAYQGKLVDISPYLEKPNNYTGVRWAEMFWPQFLIEARDPVKRRNWVVSWASENSAFIYNKDAFRKAGLIKRDNSGNAVRDSSGKEVVDEPETWADLITAFQKLEQAGYYGEVCNFHPDPAPLIWQMPYITKQIYDNLIPKLDVIVPDDSPDVFEIAKCLLDGTLDLRDGEVSELWRLLYEKSEYWVPGSTAMDIRDAFNDFLRGKAATLHWVSTDLADFEDKADFELGVFPFPSLEGTPYFDGLYNETPSLRAFEFSIPRVTESRNTLPAAMDFLMYLTSPEAQRVMVDKGNTIPPIRGIQPSRRLEPFMRAIGRRGTHTTFFNPYEIGIVKEPYWAEGRTKVLDELNSLLGSIPNYTYFRSATGGTREVYQDWRKERLLEFLDNLQKYFVWAYGRAVREYAEDLHAEIRRHNHDWIGLFRSTWMQETPPDPGNALAAFEDIWRTLNDQYSMILLCQRVTGSHLGSFDVESPPIPYRTLKNIQRFFIILITSIFSLGLVVMIWRGTLDALLKDGRVLSVFLPTVLLLGTFCYFPAGSAIYHAFFKWNGADISEFIGLQNFRNLLADGILSGSFAIMGVFLIASILKLTPTIVVAVVLFHLASRTLQYWFRVAFVLPLIIPSIVGMLVWKYFYKMDGGVLNALLLRLDVIQVPVNWLGSENTVVPALLFIGFPFVSTIGVLILMAGLQAIPGSVFEAAELDGCGAVHRFWLIEMPLIMGQVKLNLVLTTIGTLQEFALPLILTRGGPNNASMLPGLWMYLNAFSYGKMGYASALGVVMFLIILGFTLVNMKVAKSHVD